MQTFLDSTPTIVFLSIALASFVYVCVSSVFGHEHDGIGHDADTGEHEYSAISLYSPKVLALFGLAFGAGGGCASIYGVGILTATLIGMISGAILGAIAYFALKLLYGQQINSLITDGGIVGCTGEVVTRIPVEGYGEVTFIARGQSLTQLATSATRTELRVGTKVKIVRVSGNSLQVQELQD